MAEKDRRPTQKTPGTVVTEYAFKYSRSFYDFASKKLPELDQYPRDAARGPLLQAAIIVAALIQMERRNSGAGRNELHQDVARSFPPSVERRQLAAVQDLACALLQLDRAELPERSIPSFASLAGAPDSKLVGEIGEWVALAMAKKPELGPSDAKVAAAVGKSAWTSAAMIARMLQPKPKS
ncbi:MAG TPA: hypothetical protein VH309_08445 [Elusimicrobiota bacterium]|nr:hypothetical protein [Elusimicrobiota bacterium]